VENPDPKCKNAGCPKLHCPLCERTHTRANGEEVTYRRHVPDDPMAKVCTHCLGAARRRLREIPDLVADIEAHVHHGFNGRSPGISARTSKDAEAPVMGGNRLVLIAPGNAPDSRNTLHQDNLDTDPPAVLAHLIDWEWVWRRKLDRRETCSATFTDVCEFLSSLLTWASKYYADFEPFYTELHGFHTKLEQAAVASKRPVRDVAECLDHPDEPVHLQREWLPRIVNKKTGEPVHHGGLSEKWTCPKCKRLYDAGFYYMARRETMRRDEARAEAVLEAKRLEGETG
jgi:hypothetical protein